MPKPHQPAAPGSIVGRVRAQFDRQAGAYAVSPPHASGESLQVITELAAGRRYSIGVDLATGPGFTALAMAPFCERVLATDISQAMLAEARRIAYERKIRNVAFAFVSANHLPVLDGSVDLVTCRTAPHHFQDVPGFLAEVERVLVPGGAFLLADTCTSENPGVVSWHQEMELVRDPAHVRNLPASEWAKVIRDAGLRVDFETITRVEMTFSQWTGRSGTPAATVSLLWAEWENAPPDVVDEFRIEAAGDDFNFSWPCYVARALKHA